IRMQRPARDDAAHGDQDLLLGSFQSFLTAARDRARTNAGDYLGNGYSTVTPWWLPRHGPVVLRLAAPPPAPPHRGRPPARPAPFALPSAPGAPATGLAGRRLTAPLPLDDRTLRTSMLRQGRGLRPLGLRNGIRATVYPMSQLARRLRGG